MTRALLNTPILLRRMTAHPVDLPLQAPLETGAGTFDQRATLLLRAETMIYDQLNIGWGEAAPLSGWTIGSCGEFIKVLNTISYPIAFHNINELDALLPEVAGMPALRAGVELALLDALARAECCPLAALLRVEHHHGPINPVAVQRTLGSTPPRRRHAAIQQAVGSGYRAVKLKVGVAPLALDIQRIRALVEAFPDLIVRLDANGAWTVDEALRALTEVPVALIEQPVAPAEFERLLAHRAPGGAGIAADESCSNFADAMGLIKRHAVDALVIKPNTLGGLLPAIEILAQARRAGTEVIVSNLMESAVGRVAAAHLAAAWPEFAGPHGLATGQWFAADLGPAPDRVSDGKLWLPDQTFGLGFEPLLAPA